MPKHIIEKFSEEELLTAEWFNKPDVVSAGKPAYRIFHIRCRDRRTVGPCGLIVNMHHDL
mgnify:CR=1 FL=1